ncbi:hypothetical protein RIF29_12533 [Crotalaria pallida]|uniref:Replication factor A C-terminal domain-containing protein n=1 Tax=Crotalaria pallida TaxID=3830 RepID=A0AAN9P182_CROPI
MANISRKQIALEDKPEDILKDIIGVVKEYGTLEPYQYRGGVGHKLIVNISDERNNTLRLIFFKDHSQTVLDFLNGPEQPKVIALQLGKASNWKGLISATTFWEATKILFNPSIPETLLLQESAKDQTPTQAIRSSQLIDGTQSTVSIALTNPEFRKNIMDIKTTEEAGRYSVVAKIEEIIEDNNWCYDGCDKCPTKIIEKERSDENMGIWCKKCNKEPNMTLRFKIQVKVRDEVGYACFTIFDRDAFNLLKKTAIEFKDEMIKANDEFGYPEEFYNLIGKECIFVVDVKAYYNIEKKSDNFNVVTIVETEHGSQRDKITPELTDLSNEFQTQSQSSQTSAKRAAQDSFSLENE